MVNRAHGKVNLLVLLIVAAVLLGLALAAYWSQEKSTGEKFKPTKPFGSINLDKVAQIKINTPENTFTIKKKSDQEWGMDTRGGYPVQKDLLQRTVLAISDLETADFMTKSPEKYEKLGVSDAKPTNSHIQFLDADGKLLGGLYAGSVRKSHSDEGGFAPPDGQYIRVEGDDPSVYVIKEQMTIDTLPQSWLAKDVIKVDDKSLQEIKVDSRGTTDSFALARTGADPFKITTKIPDPFKERQNIAASVSHALGSVSLSDVLPVSDPKVAEIDFGTTYTATQKNGLIYTVGAGKLGEDRYIRIAASYDKAKDFSLSDQRTSDSVAAKTFELAGTTLKKANEQHRNWVYKIPSYQFDNIAKKFSDLLEPKVVPGTPADKGKGAKGAPMLPGSPLKDAETDDDDADMAIPPDKPPPGS